MSASEAAPSNSAAETIDIVVDSSTTPPATQDLEPGEIVENDTDGTEDEGQVLETDGPSPFKDGARTVFEDPVSFNVKHPLYSPWTLWFDSPATKSRNMPTPSTPGGVPQTPMTPAAQGWMEDIKKVISFDSVEEFWGLYNNIIPPSQLPPKANYYLFKEGIIPAWEDAANKDGGKWSIQLPKDKNRMNIDQWWLFTMLGAIGETFDPSLSGSSEPTSPSAPKPPKSLITGVIVSARPQFYRISIWTRLAPQSTPSPVTNSAPLHPEDEGEPLRVRIESIGKHFKTKVLSFSESSKLAGPLATEVEFTSHKDSEKKGKTVKKWIV